MSTSLWSHRLQHTNPPCLSISSRVCSNSCPFSQWCHLTISSSVAHFSSCLQSFQTSRSYWVGSLHLGTEYWSFSFSISPLNEYSELISLKIDCFDYPAVQRTIKNLLQHHNSKASNFQHSAFFMVQLTSMAWVQEKKQKA